MTNHIEMLERMARAIAARNGFDWELVDSKSRDYLMGDARACLTVLLEPTPEMLSVGMDAAQDALDSDYDSNDDGDRFEYSYLRSDAPSAIFSAMIRSILEEKKPVEPSKKSAAAINGSPSASLSSSSICGDPSRSHASRIASDASTIRRSSARSSSHAPGATDRRPVAHDFTVSSRTR